MFRSFGQSLRRRPLLEILEDRTVLTAAVALTTTNELVLFELENPAQTTLRPIQGLRDGETVLGLDYRPRDFQLYAISNANRMLRINTATGMATQVGAGSFSTPLVGSKFGVDFNPTVDRLRVVSDAEQNLRLNPDTGGVAAVDLPLWYSHVDPFFFTDPNVVSAAYLNNVDGATETLLFVIDSYNATTVVQAPPNDGMLSTFGYLDVNSSDLVGFDIVNQADGFAIFSVGLFETPTLYYVDPFTGYTFGLGEVGTDRLVLDFAIALPLPSGPGSGASGQPSDLVTGLQLGELRTAPVLQEASSALAQLDETVAPQPVLPPPAAAASATVVVAGSAEAADAHTWDVVDRVFAADLVI